MFLIHQLRRPDELPARDLGIRRAVQRCWSQDRTYAAALLWASLRAGPDH
jgi:DNA-3-methyladenine glycosylase II